MFNPIKLVTFIYQARFQGQKVASVGRTIKSCTELYFKIMKL